MNYVISDLHGCYDKYKVLLEKINFSENDNLYFLGDALDRGPNGFKILLDMANRPNVFAIMGNHEAMAIEALPVLVHMRKGDTANLTRKEVEAAGLWIQNGGATSFKDFMSLGKEDRQKVWDYMKSLPLYREIEVGGREFLLLHGGLKGYSPDRQLDDYAQDDIVWHRPRPVSAYYPDKCVIVGHTPVQLMYEKAGKQESKAKIFKGKGYIDIDCGCVFEDGRLGCLCLDTMEEIYV